MDRSTSLHSALNVLQELHRNGYAVVLLAPSRAMLDAGARVSDLSDSTLQRIYSAMLQAAAEDLP